MESRLSQSLDHLGDGFLLVFPHAHCRVASHVGWIGTPLNRHDNPLNLPAAGQLHFLSAPETFQDILGFIPKINDGCFR